MSSAIFVKTLNDWDHELRKKKRKILLLVDNCAAHPIVPNLKFIRLVFLPPNTTAVLQPMDQGVIRSLKANYRKLLVFRIIDDSEQNIETIITVFDAILMVAKAWDCVSSVTIANCFRHAGLSVTPVIQNCADESLDALSNALSMVKLDSDLSASDFVQIDDNVITAETMSDEEIALHFQPQLSDEKADEDDVDEDNFGTLPTFSEARAAILVLQKFFVTGSTDAEEGALKLLDKAFDMKFLTAQTNFYRRILWKIETKF